MALRNGMCEVPTEVLTNDSFKVSVVGELNGSRLPSSKVTVIQRRC